MDWLHYKILQDGSECWALLASIDNPHIYLPVRCKIHKAEQYNSLRYSYTLKPIDFADTTKNVLAKFNHTHWRTFNYEKHRTKDTLFQLDTSLVENNKQIAELWECAYPDEYLVALAPMVFETRNECVKALADFELAMTKDLAKMLRWISARAKTLALDKC